MNDILHANILGAGTPLLILHGFLGMSDNWKTLGNQYADEGFQVHLIDQRNHGKSFWSSKLSYDLLAEDLLRYMDHHNLPQAVILGHSMGGKTAMRFACTYPQRVEKLIVADIAPKYYPPHHQQILDGLNAMDLPSYSSRGDADKALKAHIPDFGTRQFLLKNLYWKEKGLLAFRFNLEVLTNEYEAVGEAIGPGESFPGSTLFLRGDRSEYIAPADEDEIRKHFPFASVITISNAGHWLHAENPEEFFSRSMEFLRA